MAKYSSRTYIAIPPGKAIKEQLEYRGMTQKEFAARMDMSEKHISKLLNGEVHLTPETSVKLEMVLGVPASIWNNYEALYREDIIKINIENSLDDDVEIAEKLPYKEMVKLGWIPSTTKISEKVINLRKFFEVIDLSLLNSDLISGLDYRKTDMTDIHDLALLAWLQKAKRDARDIETEPINIRKLGNSLPDIRKLTLLPTVRFCSEAKAILSECGIVLVILPPLKNANAIKKTFLDGNKIIIAFAEGEYEAGQFWSMLFNEFARIMLGYVGKRENIAEVEDKETDIFAGNLLIEHCSFDKFRERRDYSENSVLEFAKKLGIEPGIVVRRMQTDGLIDNHDLDSLKQKYTIAG